MMDTPLTHNSTSPTLKRREIVDGMTFCKFHAQWEAVEDFAWTESGDRSVPRRPRANCRLAEQTIRDHGKESDPARYAIEGRAKSYARDLSKALGQTVGYRFVLVELNWQALIPVMEALLGPRGLCLNCGKHRQTARELHIEHRIPPLSLTDWAANHARNLWCACAGCNIEKGRSENDRAWIEREQRKWMIARDWAKNAGAKGWPPYEPVFGDLRIDTKPFADHGDDLRLFDIV